MYISFFSRAIVRSLAVGVGHFKNPPQPAAPGSPPFVQPSCFVWQPQCRPSFRSWAGCLPLRWKVLRPRSHDYRLPLPPCTADTGLWLLSFVLSFRLFGVFLLTVSGQMSFLLAIKAPALFAQSVSFFFREFAGPHGVNVHGVRVTGLSSGWFWGVVQGGIVVLPGAEASFSASSSQRRLHDGVGGELISRCPLPFIQDEREGSSPHDHLEEPRLQALFKDINVGHFMSISSSLSQERLELCNIAIEIILFHFDDEELGPSPFFFASIPEATNKGEDKVVP